jgi:phosphatidylserine decarboxylase
VKLPIAAYGLRVAGVSFAASVAATIAASLVWGVWGLVFITPGFFVLFFFRDPERHPDDDCSFAVLAPADGKVVTIGEAKMPGSGEQATVVDIFLSVMNVHINRAPVAGVIVETKHTPGKFLNALRAEAGDVNENNLIRIRLDDGREIAIRQIAGVIARRIVCGVRPGDKVAAGERIGMIMFGSRTQLLLPAGIHFGPRVAIGQSVRAGKTVLGHMG